MLPKYPTSRYGIPLTSGCVKLALEFAWRCNGCHWPENRLHGTRCRCSNLSLSLYSAMLRGLKALADVAEIRGSEVVEQGCV